MDEKIKIYKQLPEYSEYEIGETILHIKRGNETYSAVFLGFEEKNDKLRIRSFSQYGDKFHPFPNENVSIALFKTLADEELCVKVKNNRIDNTIDRQIIYDYLTEERKVKYLVHFTPITNLKSILDFGILPRDAVEEICDPNCADQGRLDNHRELSCFTLSFPNYKMLYSKRQNTNESYVILYIDIDVILDETIKNIYFLPVNAASKDHTDILEYSSLCDAKNQFKETVCYKNKRINRSSDIDVSYTTNPQAEIMIKGDIDPKYIREIDFGSKSTLEEYKNMGSVLPENVNVSFGQAFKPREDYYIWQDTNHIMDLWSLVF